MSLLLFFFFFFFILHYPLCSASMAEHVMPMSLFQTSSDSSSDKHTFGCGSSSHPQLPLPLALTPPLKRPRGRPLGSKNKARPPIVVIEIPAGGDVVEAIVQFAHRRHIGISVLSVSGSISNATLRHAVSNSSSCTLHGPFSLLSLNGTYISPPPSPPLVGGASASSSSSSSSLPNPARPPYAAAPSGPDSSSFGIWLSGTQGQIIAGVVSGKVVASSNVVVVATMFKNPEFHNAGSIHNGEEEGNNNNPNVCVVGGTSNVVNSHHVPGDVSVMPWSHTQCT